MIVQGANDPRVTSGEAEQVIDALRAARVPYEYLLFENEGHGIAKPANRLRFCQAAERFLACYLGGLAE